MSSPEHKQEPLDSRPQADIDVFTEESDHDFHYKTLSWQVSALVDHHKFFHLLRSKFVSLLMVAEIVSNGMLSLPSSLAVVGGFPG
jgi:hypothetical protein